MEVYGGRGGGVWEGWRSVMGRVEVCGMAAWRCVGGVEVFWRDRGVWWEGGGMWEG